MNSHNLSIATFGIELETCICANKGPLTEIKQPIKYKKLARNIYVDRLNEIARDNSINTTFRYEADPRKNVDYSLWTVTTDNSIKCSFQSVSDTIPYEENYKSGQPTIRCSNFSDSVEIVTPIYSYTKEGHSDFCKVVENVLLNDEFTYTNNASQGMHVNVSHPGYYDNVTKTLQMWWYFEPLLVKFVRTYHRGSYYVRMLRNIFPTFENVTNDCIGFYAKPEVAPAKYTALCLKHNRFEFRIANARMTTDHIAGWLGLCVRFVVSSQQFVKPEGADQGTFDELFKYIDNDEIKQYFSNVIVEYNDPEYNRLELVVNNLNEGSIAWSDISNDDFTKICTYNLVNTTDVFYKLLKADNHDLLQILVNISAGEDINVMLNFKSIVINFDVIKNYKTLLLSVIPTLNELYSYIILTLFGDNDQDTDFNVPHQYLSDMAFFNEFLGIQYADENAVVAT